MMSDTSSVEQFTLDIGAEAEAQQQGPIKQHVDANTSTEIAAKIGELMRQSGVDDDTNPLAAEKIQRNLAYQKQIEDFQQPENAPELQQTTTAELDRLESMQKELEAAKAEASRWKKEFGRREGKVGGMESRIKELEGRMSQVQPTIDVRAITGREPGDAITAQDAVNLLMSQSGAFGNAMRQLREELLAQNSTQQDAGLPLDMEAELVEAHPWLTDLPRPQKLRAMQDILSSAGVTVTPPNPTGGQPQRLPNQLPDAAHAPVRQVAYIEPSNRGSGAERNAALPERQAFNDKVSKLKELINGPYRPGTSDKAAELLASLGAGPVDETQMGYLNRRR